MDIIQFKHHCQELLSELSAGGDHSIIQHFKSTEKKTTLEHTDLCGWLVALCSILANLQQNQGATGLNDNEQHHIMYDALLHMYGVQLREIVNYFVVEYFKVSKRCKHKYDEPIALIKNFGFGDTYQNDILDFLCGRIELHISKKFKGEYDEPVLPLINEWISSSLINFCEKIFATSDIEYLKRHFEMRTHAALSRARAHELFDMVRDFPESTPAIVELRHVSQTSGMMSFLGKTLRRALCGRLLHLGASTSDIIDVYVKMIRCFRILDPSNLLLNYVAKPIRKYLVGRKDTIRCIVSSLTEGDDDNLHSELRAGGSLEYGAGIDSDEEEDEEESPDIHWNPAKRALDFSNGREGGQAKDVLALLVSIYGSTDLFVTEYRSILAGRLLQNYEYFSDVEVKTLELLKIRFGEEPLHSCEVMLHDIDSSKRLNTAISAAIRSVERSDESTHDVDLSAIINYCIISDEYWPSLHVDSTITHHPRAARLQSKFSDTFDDIKKPKKLEIAPQLGQVFLELDFEDGTTREFSVTPTQATLILLLADVSGGSASVHYLAEKCDLAESDVRKRMVYWVSRHVVREVILSHDMNDGTDTKGFNECEPSTLSLGYEIIEEQAASKVKSGENSSLNTDFDMTGNEDIEFNGISIEADETLALSSYEAIITGILKSQGGKQLESIHSMLKMVAAEVSGGVRYDLSIVQLRKLLQGLVSSDKLEIVDGLYKFRKGFNGE